MKKSKRVIRHQILSRLYRRLREDYEFEWTEDAFTRGHLSLRQIDGLLAFKSDVQLEELRGALERLENDTFGTCLSCKGEISQELLDADPTQRMCAHCEEQFSHIVIRRQVTPAMPIA
jgi:RNA polymerase-binding transcription factor DksA